MKQEEGLSSKSKSGSKSSHAFADVYSKHHIQMTANLSLDGQSLRAHQSDIRLYNISV
jgi:hypothetical protein